MSKNFGLKGGELDSSPRPGHILVQQRAATLPKAERELYLWLSERDSATRSDIWDHGFNPSLTKPLLEKGLITVTLLYNPDIHSLFRVAP